MTEYGLDKSLYLSEWNNYEVFGPKPETRYGQGLENLDIVMNFGSKELVRVAKSFKHNFGAESTFGLSITPDLRQGVGAYTDLSRSPDEEIHELDFPKVVTWINLKRTAGPTKKDAKISVGIVPQISLESTKALGPLKVNNQYSWAIGNPPREMLREAIKKLSGKNFDADFAPTRSKDYLMSLVKSPQRALSIIEIILGKYFKDQLYLDGKFMVDITDGMHGATSARWDNLPLEKYVGLIHEIKIWSRGGDTTERPKLFLP